MKKFFTIIAAICAIACSGNTDPKLLKYCKSLSVPVLEYDAAAFENGSYIDAYNAFYDTI